MSWLLPAISIASGLLGGASASSQANKDRAFQKQELDRRYQLDWNRFDQDRRNEQYRQNNINLDRTKLAEQDKIMDPRRMQLLMALMARFGGQVPQAGQTPPVHGGAGSVYGNQYGGGQ